jgi:hypothetical protein
MSDCAEPCGPLRACAAPAYDLLQCSGCSTPLEGGTAWCYAGAVAYATDRASPAGGKPSNNDGEDEDEEKDEDEEEDEEDEDEDDRGRPRKDEDDGDDGGTGGGLWPGTDRALCAALADKDSCLCAGNGCSWCASAATCGQHPHLCNRADDADGDHDWAILPPPAVVTFVRCSSLPRSQP